MNYEIGREHRSWLRDTSPSIHPSFVKHASRSKSGLPSWQLRSGQPRPRVVRFAFCVSMPVDFVSLLCASTHLQTLVPYLSHLYQNN